MPTLTPSCLPRILIRISSLLLLTVAIPVPRACAQKFFLTPVANRPFSAELNVEETARLRDGSIAQLKTTRQLARDMRGRIHNELRAMVSLSSEEAPPLLSIHLYDPETRLSTEIDAMKRTFWTVTVNHPPNTQPPSIGYSDPDGSAPPNEFTKQEDLGVREIEGLPVHGIRQMQTMTEKEDGKQWVVTDEYWYSQDLRINLMVKHTDPRWGTRTFTVTHVVRREPNPTLFEIPEGYSETTPPQRVPTSPMSLTPLHDTEKTN
jgi:hypothetical protein